MELLRAGTLTDGTVAVTAIITRDIPLMKLVTYFWNFEGSNCLRANIWIEDWKKKKKNIHWLIIESHKTYKEQVIFYPNF